MEQTRCLMWTKRKHNLNSSHLEASQPSLYDHNSWEEQAFAEDAAGPLGGCIWPPRSYSCSFCRREFRSAQALGGHMNVHRRDRARLKHSPPVPHNEVIHPHHHDDHQNHINFFQNPYTSLGFQYPSHPICALVYSPNPNSDPGGGTIPSPSSPSNKASTTPTEANCDEKNFFPPLSSSNIVKDEHEKRYSRSSSPSKPNSAADRYYHISDPRNEGEEKDSRIIESGCRAKVDYVRTDLSVSLNLVLRRTRPTISDEEEEEEEPIACKRRKKSTSSLPLFKKSNSAESHYVQSEAIGIIPCSVEELDLELRLGYRPKVK